MAGVKKLANLLALLLLAINVQVAQGQDWTRFRNDAELIGRAQLKTPSQSPPANFASFQLGGGGVQPLIADLDGDGQPELIFLRQGRLIAVHQNGAELIDSFFGITDLVAVADLDNDGKTEIIAIDTFERILLVINSNGQLRWQYQFPEFVTLSPNYIKVADLAPEYPGKEIVTFPDHTKTMQDAHGYFFTSQGQLYSNPVVPNLNGGQLNFPQLAIGDIDGNGSLQVVVQGRPFLMVFSGEGDMLRELDYREGDPEGRHYGLLTLADVNGDHKLDAVVIADDIPALPTNGKSMAITVLSLSPKIKRLWGATFPGSANQLLHAPLHAVADLNGDGNTELVVDLWTGSRQEVRVYQGAGDPANPGQPLLLTTIPDRFVWDLQDLDLDGRPDLMASEETVAQPVLTINSQLHIYRLMSATSNTFAFLDAAKPVTGMYALAHAFTADQTLQLIGSSDDSRMTEFTLATTPRKFLVYAPGLNGDIDLQEQYLSIKQNKFRILTDLDTKRPGIVRALLGGAAGSEQLLINLETDGIANGQLAIFTRHNKHLRQDAGATFTAASFSTDARVADLDGSGANVILARAPAGKILILGYDDQLNSLTQLTAFNGQFSPIIESLDGSNSRPQIITTTGDNGRLRLEVYDTRGAAASGNLRVVERWGVTFSDIAADTDVDITTGHFGGLPNRVDIFISTSRGHCLAISGANGSTLWTRPDVFTFGNYAAVRDANQDGKDDIYIVADNMYHILDGGSGKDLVTPINVATLGGDFDPTPMLSGANEVLLVGPATVIKILDNGKLLWNFAKTINGQINKRQNSQLLMGLAEIGNGGGFDIIGGNYGEGDAFYGYDYFTGLLKYKTPYQPITNVISADIDGDGKDEFIFGSADGQIVALHAIDGSLLWAIPTNAFPSDPILATVGINKKQAVIFCAGDGALRVYPLN